MSDVDKQTAMGAGIVGIFILICGVGNCITGFVWIDLHGGGGYGLWSGAALVVAGILGVVTWWTKNKGVVIGFLVVCIIVTIIAMVQAIISGLLYALVNAVASNTSCHKDGNGCVCRSSAGTRTTLTLSFCDKWNSLVGGLLAFTILSSFGSIFCLVGSIIGCIGACAGQQGQPGTVVVQQPVVMTTMQHQGYPQQQAGYPQQQAGYPQQQGYPQQPVGYNNQAASPPQYTEK